MQSHTIPRKLLKQFSYYDAKTKSSRLWRYEKGKAPRSDASPRSATRIAGHFAAPDNEKKEFELEQRLNREFEEPVNRYLNQIGQPEFRLTSERRRQLTFYLTLLFFRSEARRKASHHTNYIVKAAFRRFIESDIQTRTLAAHWNICELERGIRRRRLFNKDDVVDVMTRSLTMLSEAEQIQRGYVWLLEETMKKPDEVIMNGDWNFITTDAEYPFIISDAPLTTWQRNEKGMISMGLGTHEPNVEILLPISPLVCLHILPSVERTLSTRTPHASEVNAAQAAFAGRYCFANLQSKWIDQIVQANQGSAELGVKSFIVAHRDYTDAIYKLFMATWPHRLIAGRAKVVRWQIPQPPRTPPPRPAAASTF